MVECITPEWLFLRAEISKYETAAWRQRVAERGPGVYVVSIDNTIHNGQNVVYVGRSNHLSRRLGEFYRHRFAERSTHKGGEAILMLDGVKMVHWASVANYAQAEHRMLTAFHEVTHGWPFGNKVKSAQVRTF